jgi:hypothetical protein
LIDIRKTRETIFSKSLIKQGTGLVNIGQDQATRVVLEKSDPVEPLLFERL